MALAPFPLTWHWTMTIQESELAPKNAEQAFEAVTRALHAEGDVSTDCVDDRMEFKSMNFLTRRSRLSMITAGAVTITQLPGEFRIRFELTFLYIFLVAVGAAVVFWLQAGMPSPSFRTAEPFLYLYGVAVAVTMVSFERLLKRALKLPPPHERERTT
jgi:hypothetical protein